MNRTMTKWRRGTRTGFTTGACAAAAARAATLGLLQEQMPKQVETVLPNGQRVTFVVADAVLLEPDAVQAVVIKDAGDDPDCTHGARLTAMIRRLPGAAGEIRLLGGVGVGRVTRSGLGLPLQAPAINPIPRNNILANIQAVAGPWLAENGLEVTISVPDGAMMAKRTLNPRLGIVGGISILGTTGIVHPYSTSAFKAAVQQAIEAAAQLGVEELVLATGRRSERFAMTQRPDLPEYAFVQMGDFIGAALASLATTRISHLIVAVMPGKLAKIAQGMDNTHAHKGEVDMHAVAAMVRQAGGDDVTVRQVADGITVRHATELMTEKSDGEVFGMELARRAMPVIRSRLPPVFRVTILLFNFNGTLLATLEHVPVLEK
ncbi:MAG: cobalt-precorrin-5B (C(1))-methyltransferase [Magnetococcus sp. YQC-5]